MNARMQTRRLRSGEERLAGALFQLMVEVFEEAPEPLGEAYLASLLARPDFWAFAAFVDGALVGGLTAHTLPMTRGPYAEVFIYDLAVRAEHQRRGIGRQLVAALREAARAQGISDVFVDADNEDNHALDFYRAVGGAATPVTMFSFTEEEESTDEG